MQRAAYRDRSDAGRQLARALTRYAKAHNAVVLGLPRGGTSVAYEVAIQLHLPLDVFVVSKLPAPGVPSLSIGAVSGDGTCFVDRELARLLRVHRDDLNAAVRRELYAMHERERSYRGLLPECVLDGRAVLAIDDGVETGATMRAVVAALERRSPASIAIAVPVGNPAALHELAAFADRVICPYAPQPFDSIRRCYERFEAVSDEEVRRLLHGARLEARRWHVA